MSPETARKRRYADSKVVQYVRSLPQDFYLTREVATELNVAPTMLNYLARFPERGLGPSHQAGYGGLTLRLYSSERVEEIRTYLAEHKRGSGTKRRLFTPLEQVERRRLAQQIRNHERAARDWLDKGREAQAAASTARAEALRTQFNDERIARCAELGLEDNYRAKPSKPVIEDEVTAGLS